MDSHLPLYVRIGQQAASLAARAGGNQKFMSVRELARTYRASVPTVMKAVRQLKAEGVLVARHGLGTFVVSRLRPDFSVGCVALMVSGGAQIHFDRVYLRIMAGVYETLADAKYQVEFINAGARDAALAREVRQADVAGVIWVNPAVSCVPSLQALRKAGVKVVGVDLRQRDVSPCSVAADLHGEGYQAAAHLLAHGHRKIVRVDSGLAAMYGREFSIEGFNAALRAHGARVDARLNLPPSDFAARLETLIDLKIKFTAIFVPSPLFGVVMETLRRKKVRVPAEVAVITEDDCLTLDMEKPVPTRVARPLRQLGEVAARKMIEWITTGEQPRSEALAWEVIKGETVGGEERL